MIKGCIQLNQENITLCKECIYTVKENECIRYRIEHGKVFVFNK